MVRVAIAGGTGGLGRTLVDAFVQENSHDIFVLTRKDTDIFQDFSRVQPIVTKYGQAELVEILRHHEIHTVISTLNPPVQQVTNAELALVRAASQSGTVKRFIPSEFAIDYYLDDDHLPLSWKHLRRAITTELTLHPNLEHTVVHNGYFMDYFGLPHAPTHMIPEIPFVDIVAGEAAIPGTGREKVVFTHTTDVARFVVRLVDDVDTKWAGRSVVVGDTVTFEEVVGLVERVRAAPFTFHHLTHDSVPSLRKGQITEIPAYRPLYEMFGSKESVLEMFACFGLAMALGDLDYETLFTSPEEDGNGDETRDGDGKEKENDGKKDSGGDGKARHKTELLNSRYPDLGTTTIKMEEFIGRWWGGK